MQTEKVNSKTKQKKGEYFSGKLKTLRTTIAQSLNYKGTIYVYIHI